MNSEVKLRRRTFMKAVGMGLSAPLALHFARMATAAPGARPKRLLIYFMPHGVPNEHMDMAPYLTVGGEFADFGANPDAPLPGVHVNPDYTFETRTGLNLLSPLEPYRNMMHVVRGLYQSGSFQTHDSIGAILTGDGVSPSVDQLVAQELGLSSLALGAVPRMGESLDSNNGVLVRDSSDWVVPDGDVVALNDRLFGGIQGGAEPVVDLSAEFRADALNLTISEISALRQEVSGLTQADSKLAAHLAALEKLKSSDSGLGAATGDACNAAPVIPHIEDLRGADAGKQEWEPRYWLEMKHFEKIAEAQAEVAAHALLCGHAQIVTLQNMWASADIALPTVLPHRPSEPHHNGISHKGFTGDFQNSDRLDFATAQRWFMTRVARICEILNQPDPFDPDHTALENSLIYVCSEIADGNLHGKRLERMWITGGNDDIFQYYPAIIVGGGGGALKPGSLVTVDNRPISDLLLTLARAMGSSVTAFGGAGTTVLGEILA
jgi:hypothetical protein